MKPSLRRGLGWAFLAGFVLFLTACGGSTSESERAARTFVEAYYVRADLVAARRLAVGLAREKIDQQVKLRTLAGADHEPVSTSPGLAERRSVTYEVLETRERQGDRKVYRFGLTISTAPLTLEKETLITVGAQGEGENRRWLVLNFVDFNRPSTRNAGK